MAINVQKIDTELTLELGDDEITPSEFTSAVEHFLGLAKEVAGRVAGGSAKHWLIKVYPGSAGIGLYERRGTVQPTLAVVRNAVIEGIEALERGERPATFSDKAIEHARGVSRVFAKRQTVAKIRLWSKNERAVSVKDSVAINAAKILDPVFEDYGSVDGRLEVVSGHGHIECTIYDTLDDHAIKCEIGHVEIQTVLASFLKRVEVYGRVRYRRDGTPVAVKADRIIQFPSNDSLPNFAQLRGIMRE